MKREVWILLLFETKSSHKTVVTLRALVFEVFHVLLTICHHLQKTSARVYIFWVALEVL